MDGRTLSANQIEFMGLIIDHLTERGVMDPRRLYESPFTDLNDQGLSGVFPAAEVKRWFSFLMMPESGSRLEIYTSALVVFCCMSSSWASPPIVSLPVNTPPAKADGFRYTTSKSSSASGGF